MKIMTMKKIMAYMNIAAFLLLLLPLAQAYGVSSPFWDTRPLMIQPGETQEVTLQLQNMVGGEDIIFRASIEEGKEIVTILDDDLDFYVPYGSKDVLVKLKVTAPEDAEGKTYRVGILFAQRSAVLDGDGGTVQLAGGIKTVFPVKVEIPPPPFTEQEPLFSGTTLLVVAGIVLSGAVMAYLIFRKKEEEGL